MNFEKEVIEIRRHAHKNPELSGKEYNTAKFIESKLKEFNIPYKRAANTGVIADLHGAKKGKTAALRADMDALPVSEQNSFSYKSVNSGIMHACGHDGHIAIILGAAKILSKNKNALNGSVRFIFQPAEEVADGANNMIKAGALRDPKPDVIFGAHVCPWIKSGKVGIKYGAMMAGVDKIKIEINGEIAHGAYPHLSKDAIVAAGAFISGVQSVVSREIAPSEPAVITFGQISGGTSYNIICDKVTLTGTVRALNNKTRNIIKKSVLNKLKSLERAYGVKCFADYRFIDEPLINTGKITRFCHKTAAQFYGKNNVVVIDESSMGGEDFANYLKEVPGNFIYIGSSKDKKTSYPWHHCNFDIDESALPAAARYLAYTVEKFLK
ncbi:MAG: amidohydrolase [Endomicrobium sp.]|jgi:amidohydrolase|nr:amidohydrolase [Endomicrobium sp.]